MGYRRSLWSGLFSSAYKDSTEMVWTSGQDDCRQPLGNIQQAKGTTVNPEFI